MAEIQLQLREQKTLKALSETTEPVRAGDLEENTGETALNMGNSLRQLAKLGVAELMDKRSKLWRITESGKEIAATIQLPLQTPSTVTPPVTPSETTPVTPSVIAPVAPPAPALAPAPAPAQAGAKHSDSSTPL